MQKFRGLSTLPENATYDEMDSPVGLLTIIASPEGLRAIFWDQDRKSTGYDDIIKSLKRSMNCPIIVQTKLQLNEYFKGLRKVFDLPLIIDGTNFQNQVWNELLKIPYGGTISYGTQASRIGDKNKARAVGTANGQNPISIVIPCHRVIASNGSLAGFAGGLDRKEYLLKLEQQCL